MKPELHRPVPPERIGPVGLTMTVEATPGECRAIAKRLAIPAVASFHCTWTLRAAPNHVVEAEGRLQARVTRTCVLSLEDFDTDVTDEFAIRFVPAGQESDDPDPDAVDESPYDGAIDLGEASVEQLALALDPYPRAPDAEPFAEEADGEEAPVNPFAALEALRRKLN